MALPVPLVDGQMDGLSVQWGEQLRSDHRKQSGPSLLKGLKPQAQALLIQHGETGHPRQCPPPLATSHEAVVPGSHGQKAGGVGIRMGSRFLPSLSMWGRQDWKEVCQCGHPPWHRSFLLQ